MEALALCPGLMDASVGRNMTEKPPELLLFITEFSSDGDEHVSILASRSSGDPDICIDRGSTETHCGIRRVVFLFFSDCNDSNRPISAISH